MAVDRDTSMCLTKTINKDRYSFIKQKYYLGRDDPSQLDALGQNTKAINDQSVGRKHTRGLNNL